MAKVYGVTFLGAPRTREAENACCAPVLMGVSVVALALCCIAGGVAAPWLLPLLGNAIPLPLTAHTTVSQPMIALLLIAAPLLPFVLMLFFKRDRLASARAVRRGPAATNTNSRWSSPPTVLPCR
jgi:formate hydrogenlyase subunit 3